MSESDGMPVTSSYKCKRCKGLVISDIFICEGSYWMNGLRCVNCGWVKLEEKVVSHANKTKDRGVNKLDELQLYRTRSGRFINSSNSL